MGAAVPPFRTGPRRPCGWSCAGIRPSRLDDGLAAALRALVADAPIPVRLAVTDVAVPEVTAATLYFVVAETYAHALKHARASAVGNDVRETGGGEPRVLVSDDGARAAARTAPTSRPDFAYGRYRHGHPPYAARLGARAQHSAAARAR